MNFDSKSAVQELRELGYTYLYDVYTPSQCAMFGDKLDNIAKKRATEGKMKRTGDCHNVWNFFRDDPDLMPLVHNEYYESIFKEIIDEDFAATAINAVNRQKITDESLNYAGTWHTDSRYVGGVKLDAGFAFQALVMLDEFTAENGTHFVPGTHRDRTIPERHADYEYKTMTGKPGTIIIWDTGLWHKGGISTEKRRWGIFNTYAPWFVKPYWRYWEMVKNPEELTPELRRIFHFESVPPYDETEHLSTLTRLHKKKEGSSQLG